MDCSVDATSSQRVVGDRVPPEGSSTMPMPATDRDKFGDALIYLLKSLNSATPENRKKLLSVLNKLLRKQTTNQMVINMEVPMLRLVELFTDPNTGLYTSNLVFHYLIQAYNNLPLERRIAFIPQLLHAVVRWKPEFQNDEILNAILPVLRHFQPYEGIEKQYKFLSPAHYAMLHLLEWFTLIMLLPYSFKRPESVTDPIETCPPGYSRADFFRCIGNCNRIKNAEDLENAKLGILRWCSSCIFNPQDFALLFILGEGDSRIQVHKLATEIMANAVRRINWENDWLLFCMLRIAGSRAIKDELDRKKTQFRVNVVPSQNIRARLLTYLCKSERILFFRCTRDVLEVALENLMEHCASNPCRRLQFASLQLISHVYRHPLSTLFDRGSYPDDAFSEVILTKISAYLYSGADFTPDDVMVRKEAYNALSLITRQHCLYLFSDNQRLTRLFTSLYKETNNDLRRTISSVLTNVSNVLFYAPPDISRRIRREYLPLLREPLQQYCTIPDSAIGVAVVNFVLKMFPANDIPTRYIALKALLSPHQEVRKEVALLESGKTPRCYNMDMSLSKLPGFVDFMLHDTEFLSRFVVTNDREMNFLTTFIPLARKSLLHDHSNWERSVIKRHGLTDARSHIFVRCVAYMHTPRDSPYKQALMLYFRLICKCIFTSQKPLQEMALRENIDMYFYEIVNGAPELCLQAFGKKELKEKLNRCLLMKESAECNILALSRAYAILCVFSDPLDVQVRHAQELVSRLNNIKDSVPFLSMGDARNLCANMCSAANLLDLSREYIQWRMDFKSATVSVIPPPTKMSAPPGPHGRGAVLPEDHNRGFQRFFYQANQLPMAATKSVDKVPPSMEHTINELLGRLERALPSPDTLSQCIHCGNKVSSTGNQILPTNWYVYECAMSSLLALSSHGALMHLPIRPASAANNASVITTPTTTTNAATATTTTTSSSTASPSSPQIDILGQDWITKRPLRSQVTMLHHCWSLVLIHNLPANASSVKAAAPEFPATLPLPRSANSPTLAAGPLNLTGAEDNDKPLSSSIFQIRRISLDIIANIFCWCPQLIDVKFLNSMKLAYSAAEEPILRGICRVLVSAVRPGIVHQPLSYPWMSVEHVVDIPSESQKSKSLLVNLMTDVGREFCKQILATVLPNKSPSNLLQQLEDVLIENEDSFEAYIKTMREKRLVLSALTVPTESPAESLSLPSSTLSDEQIASDNAKKAQEYATVSYYITTMHQWLYRFYADKPAIPVLAPLPTQVHLLYSARHAYTAPMITCKMADTLCLSTLKTSIFLYFRSSPADRKLLAHLTTSSVAYINDEAMPEWFNGKRFDTRDRYSAVRILSAFSEHLHCVDIAYVLFSLYFLSAEEVKCYEDNFLYYVTDCLVQELKSYSMPLLGKSGVSGLKEIAPGQEWRQPSDSTDEEVDSIFSGDSDDLGEPKRINALLAVHINLLLFCNHPEVIIRDVMKCSLLSLNTLLGFKDLPPVGLGLLLHNILHYMRQRHSIPLVHMALHSLKYILVLKQNRFTTSQWRKHSHILLQFLSQLKQFAEYYGDKPDSSSTSSASSSSLYSSPHNSSRLMSLIEEISRALHLSFLNAPTNEIKVQYLLSLCEWLQSRLSLLLRLATRQVRAMLDTCKPQLAAFPLHQLVEGLCRAVAFAEMEAIANKSQNVAVVPEGDSQTSQPPQQQQFTDTPPATMEGDIVDLKETELPHGSDLYAGKSDSLITDIAVFGKDALLTCLKCMNSESGASMNDLIVPLVDYIRTPENKYYRYLATEFITRACNCLAPGLAGSTGKLLAALLHAVLSDNDNESRVIARAIALLMPHAKDMTVNRIFQRVRHWYIESDPSVLRYERAATYLILSACRNCPQALRSNFKALVPLVFVAMSKPVAIRERPLPPSLHIGTDAAIRCRWESTWREMVNDPISCVMMHFNEILAFIAECITTAKYAIRRDQAGFALAHLAHEEYFTTVQQAKSLYQVIIPMCDAQTVYWERKFLLFRAIYSVICTRVLKKIDGSSLEAQEKQCVDILKREASAQSDNPLCIYENIEALFMLSFVVDFLQIDVLAEVFHLFQTFFAKLLVTEQLDDESMINLENLLTALPMFWSGEATEAQKSFFPQFLNLLDPMLHHSDTMIRFHALNALTELYKRVDISLYIADPQIESVIRGFFPALKHLVTEGTFPVIRMQMLKRVVLILSMLRGHFKEETEEILKLFGKETAETSLWYNDVVTY